MRYIQKAVCYCVGCKEDIVLLESVACPGAAHQTIDPVYEGWRRFCLENKDIFICPKHSVELTLFIDGKKLEENQNDPNHKSSS